MTKEISIAAHKQTPTSHSMDKYNPDSVKHIVKREVKKKWEKLYNVVYNIKSFSHSETSPSPTYKVNCM
jgi:hypothetical protein